MSRFSGTQQGVALVILATACFVGLDTLTKYAGLAMPLLMVVWMRYVVQSVLTAGMLLPARGRGLFHTRHPRLQLLRGVLMLASSTLAFISLKAMPVGDFTALMMLAPMLITLVSALSIGDRVTPARWALLTGSFVGAIVVIRPGADDFDWATLFALGLVVLNAAFNLLTVHMARHEDAGTMHFYTGLVAASIATVLLPFAWQSVPLVMWLPVAFIGVFSGVGHYLLIQGYARTKPSTLTPYLYFQIVFATLSGWLIFSHAPDVWSVIGIVMIAVCGVANTWLSGKSALLTEAEPTL